MQNQMTENDVLSRIAELTLREVGEVQMDMHLAEDLGIDSLGIANLIAKFEQVVASHPSMYEYVSLLSNAQTVREFCSLIVGRS